VSRTRRIIVLILVVFAIYAVLVNPNQAAAVVGNAWDAVVSGLQSVGQFFDAIMKQ
jgi:hypothetical protein